MVVTRLGNLLCIRCSCYLGPTAAPCIFCEISIRTQNYLAFFVQNLANCMGVSVHICNFFFITLVTLFIWIIGHKPIVFDIEIQGFRQFQFYKTWPRSWQFILSPRFLRVSGILLGAYGQYQRNLIPRRLSIYRVSLCACALRESADTEYRRSEKEI